MSSRIEIRLAGEGGQGLVLAGLILAEAAATYDRKNAVMSQSYGAQQRGGPSRSEVIISDSDIDFPKVLQADVLLALTQDAYDSYRGAVHPDGLIIVDPAYVGRLTDDEGRVAPHVHAIPLAVLSKKAMGSEIGISIVALGAIVGLSGVVSRQAISDAVLARAPRGTEEANRRALEEGFAAAKQINETAE